MIKVPEILSHGRQRMSFSYIIDTKAADDLVIQGAMASAAMALIWSFLIFEWCYLINKISTTRIEIPWKTTMGPFYLHGLTLIPACTSNYIHHNVWDEITYPLPNFKGCTLYWASHYLSMPGLKLNHLSKSSPYDKWICLETLQWKFLACENIIWHNFHSVFHASYKKLLFLF